MLSNFCAIHIVYHYLPKDCEVCGLRSKTTLTHPVCPPKLLTSSIVPKFHSFTVVSRLYDQTTTGNHAETKFVTNTKFHILLREWQWLL